jgi:hypothetical protein
MQDAKTELLRDMLIVNTTHRMCFRSQRLFVTITGAFWEREERRGGGGSSSN